MSDNVINIKAATASHRNGGRGVACGDVQPAGDAVAAVLNALRSAQTMTQTDRWEGPPDEAVLIFCARSGRRVRTTRKHAPVVRALLRFLREQDRAIIDAGGNPSDFKPTEADRALATAIVATVTGASAA